LSVALAAAQQGAPTHYVALELGEEEIYLRLLALTARWRQGLHIAWSSLLFGQSLDPAPLFAGAGNDLDELPLTVEVARPQGWPADRLIELARQHQPRLIILDFLQLVAGQRGEDARTTMGRVAYAARAVARDHACTVLAISSTSRANYAATTGEGKPGEGNPGRFVGLGKESGEIEYAADGVLALVDDTEGFQPELGGKRVHIAVAKLRGGPISWVPPLRFDGCAFEPDDGFVTPTDSADSTKDILQSMALHMREHPLVNPSFSTPAASPPRRKKRSIYE
jgi:replicative DNA helicase